VADEGQRGRRRGRPGPPLSRWIPPPTNGPNTAPIRPFPPSHSICPSRTLLEGGTPSLPILFPLPPPTPTHLFHTQPMRGRLFNLLLLYPGGFIPLPNDPSPFLDPRAPSPRGSSHRRGRLSSCLFQTMLPPPAASPFPWYGPWPTRCPHRCSGAPGHPFGRAPPPPAVLWLLLAVCSPTLSNPRRPRPGGVVVPFPLLPSPLRRFLYTAGCCKQWPPHRMSRPTNSGPEALSLISYRLPSNFFSNFLSRFAPVVSDPSPPPSLSVLLGPHCRRPFLRAPSPAHSLPSAPTSPRSF
jgi:hypothetical protein